MVLHHLISSSLGVHEISRLIRLEKLVKISCCESVVLADCILSIIGLMSSRVARLFSPKGLSRVHHCHSVLVVFTALVDLPFIEIVS